MSLEEQLKQYLSETIKLDWGAFNEFNLMDQGRQIREIVSGFEKIILENNYQNPDAIYKIIESFEDIYSKPTIIGRNQHFFNVDISTKKGGRAFLRKFQRIIHLMEFEKAKHSSTNKCDCKVSLEFKEKPFFDHLEKIGWINDSYYFPEVYMCKKCDRHQLWTVHTSDDSLGVRIWEEYSKEDDSLLVINQNDPNS